MTWKRVALIAFAVALLGVLAFLSFRQLNSLEQQLARLESTVQKLNEDVEAAAEASRRALARATQAEQNALDAALGRTRAEQDRAEASRQAEQARQAADLASRQAQLAREETERIRREREEEIDRLQQALSKIAETRRTAVGLVMSLGGESIQFDFDKATLRPENRELLSRIAGVLLSSSGFRIQVFGHTDDVGSGEYNQELSERRARAVRDYLAEAGIDPEQLTTKGFGKSSPRVPGTDTDSRSKNRRVEIGIIDSVVHYQGEVAQQAP